MPGIASGASVGKLQYPEGEPSIEFTEFGDGSNSSCVRLGCYPSGMTEEQARLIWNER